MKLNEILAIPLVQNLLQNLIAKIFGHKQTTGETMQANTTYTPKYFDLTEFQCNHCGQLPPNGMNPILLYKLDQLRERIGAPLYVTSGYRCITHNAAVGGVSNSQHLKGNAADIYTDAMPATQLAELCKEIGFDGIGLYAQSDFVHVDVRDNGNSKNYYLW